jgi:hypothetical protein
LVNPYVYGTWGAQPLADSDLAGARAWIDDATNRGVNVRVFTGLEDAEQWLVGEREEGSAEKS